MCDIMHLATLKLETKLQECIRMGITIFKIFIWRGTCISLDICSENFLRLHSRFAVKLNFRHISNDIPPQMKILHTIILRMYHWFFKTTREGSKPKVIFFNLILPELFDSFVSKFYFPVNFLSVMTGCIPVLLG